MAEEINPVEEYILQKFEPAATVDEADITISTLALQKKLSQLFPVLAVVSNSIGLRDQAATDLYTILKDNEFILTEPGKAITPKWLLKLK